MRRNNTRVSWIFVLNKRGLVEKTTNLLFIRRKNSRKLLNLQRAMNKAAVKMNVKNILVRVREYHINFVKKYKIFLTALYKS